MKEYWKGIAALAWLFFLGVGVLGVAGVRYDVEATLDMKERSLRGVAKVAFAADSGTKCAYFLLLANLAREENPFLSDREVDSAYVRGFEPASTWIESVEAVQTEGTVVLPFQLLSLPPALQTYSLAETVLAVDLPQTGASTLCIRFTTEIPHITLGDQGITQGVLTWRIGWYPLLLPQEGWCENDGRLEACSGEGFPLTFLSAEYTARIWLPEGLVPILGADHVEAILGEETPSDEPTLSGYRAWDDSPARTLALTAGPEYERYSLSERSIPIDVFFLAGHEEDARLFATYACDILADYEQRFGPYPRARLIIVENPNREGLSMAADGIVWLSSLFFTHRDVTLSGILNRYCEFVLAHEIAHQWWGLGIGVDLNAEDWLSEGLAQYLAVGYFERRHGAFEPNLLNPTGKGILEDLVRSQVGFINLREHEIEFPYLQAIEQGFDEALIKPLAEVQYKNATSVRLYDKGYLVARALAAAVGDGVFEEGLREAAQRFRYRMMSVDDLRAVLEQGAGRSFEELFRIWLFEGGSVDYGVKILSRSRVESTYRTVVQVTRLGGAPQPVVVEATVSSGRTVRQEWDGVQSVDTVVFETEERILRVTIDPEHRLPDRDRLNNNAPIKFVVATGNNVFPLDAYLVRPDPFSQGVTVTYLDRLRVTFAQDALAAEVSWDRYHDLAFDVGIEEGDLGGTIRYTCTSFAQPETGLPGTFWEPDTQITLSGHRFVGDGDPFVYLHLGVVALPSLQYSHTSAISLDVTLSGSGRMTISSFDEVRLVPHVYLQGGVTVGMSFGDLPSPLLFNLQELRSLGRMGGWTGAPFPGRYKLYGYLAAEFPFPSEELYNLANLLLVDRVRGRAFLACGMSWKSWDEFGKTSPYVEAGVEGVFDLSALGGLLPLRAIVGYATPISQEGVGVLYIGLSL
jgi:hypothetical protein